MTSIERLSPGHLLSAGALVLAMFLQTAAGANLGSPDLEPALQGRQDIIFFEDFEYPDFYTHWGQSSVPSTCQRVSSPVFDGDSSLHVQVPQGQHTGIGWQWKFANFGLPEPEEVYFRYYTYFGDSWRKAGGGGIGKQPGIAGTYGVAGWGGRPSDGTNGWSARMGDIDRISAIEPTFYCYNADMLGIYGDTWGWGEDAYLQRERWYAIEVYGKMNSIIDGIGRRDGILRGWVDGELVFEKTDIHFRDVDSLKIECVWFNVYVGGTWTAEQDMDVYFDNMVFASDYIGPFGWEQPGLDHEIKYLGDGLYGVTFTARGNDGQQKSFFADVSFEGTSGGQIQQQKAVIIPGVLEHNVDTEAEANLYDGQGTPPYEKDRDSYFLEPFSSGDVMVLTAGDNYYYIEAGTGASGQYEDAPLAYIVCDGDLAYYGQISRLAKNYAASGIVEMPPPGDANLDGLVDGCDYTIWCDNYQQAGLGWAGGDFNGDGVVDGGDYTIWADFYTGGGSQVPEPTVVMTILFGGPLAVLSACRRKRPGRSRGS